MLILFIHNSFPAALTINWIQKVLFKDLTKGRNHNFKYEDNPMGDERN